MITNVEKFSGRAEEYVRCRERYDPEIVMPLLREWCGLTPEWIVADIGAGTGMLTEVFLANGNRVIAVEPNAEMRAGCERELGAASGLEVIAGTAEAIGLGDATVDIVSVGRAMHWFDAELAMREFRRVLKPGGWVAVVAFGRSEHGRKENEAFEEVLRSLTPDHKDTHANYSIYSRIERFFSGGEFHHEQIGGEVQFDWEELRGMTLSLSHSPLPDDPRFAEFEGELRRFFESYAQGGRVTMATRYWVNAGKFAS
jgi:SAM-dependent methyltransferase